MTSSNDSFSGFFQVCLKRCVFSRFSRPKVQFQVFPGFPGTDNPGLNISQYNNFRHETYFKQFNRGLSHNLNTCQGLFDKIRAYVRYKKRARKSSKRAQLWIFTAPFFKFRTFRTLHLPKRHVFLAFRFSKRALRAGTARNKWLK